MKKKFFFALFLGGMWLLFSSFFAVPWAIDTSRFFPSFYVWWVIIGVALLPGFFMNSMFWSNLMHRKVPVFPDTDLPITVIMCAYNEETQISRSIDAICNQHYAGNIRLIVVDNASSDNTKTVILKSCQNDTLYTVEYTFCPIPGKSHALNLGLSLVSTPYFVTVDADTILEPFALKRLMNHMAVRKTACTAGNLFVSNGKHSFFTKMQIYDYLLSIAAIKRFQGSFRSTLVAQGAFSGYETETVRALGGWKHCLGEDIVLTYEILKLGKLSTYEPGAVGYTAVPSTAASFYNQRKRWAIGMLDGFSAVRPWQQGSLYSRYFTCVNLSTIYLDLAFLFGFLPGIILTFSGHFLLAGYLTLLSFAVSLILYYSVYRYQKRLDIPFENSIMGLLCFLLFFQPIQSSAALHGYVSWILKRKEEW